VSVPSRIILIGFSGTGKSTVGRILGDRFGREFIDTDELVQQAAGKPILEIFRDEGEQAFRVLESDALAEACARADVVISTGGGVVLDPNNRRLMAESGLIVCLEARPETIIGRLSGRAGEAPLDRPLLATADPLGRVRELKAPRQPLYALADWTVSTDGLTPEEAADEIERVLAEHADGILRLPGRVEAIVSSSGPSPPGTLHAIDEDVACVVRSALRDYPVYVAWGGIARLGRRLQDVGLGRYVYVVSDEQVWHHLGDEVVASLRDSGIPFGSFTIPPGEESKTLASASAIYDWLIEQRAERGHTVVAVGGGVVTDLAGFAAATFARGIPLVHVPTSMLGQVDAAIGGKVAVNHPRAKNMVGVFDQPRFVLSDPATLRTLPPREIRSGLAEALKHGFIADEAYLRFMVENVDAVLRLDADVITHVVRRSAQIKGAVVSEDEFETTGKRSLLNYGHTLAHAIESTTDYSRFRHGEADSIGMMAAAEIGRGLGLINADAVDEHRLVFEKFGLPVRADGLDRDAVKRAMSLDKKVLAGKQRWIVLSRIGEAIVRDDVPAEVVDAALASVGIT
jgi:3-dehydroquinate synthase